MYGLQFTQGKCPQENKTQWKLGCQSALSVLSNLNYIHITHKDNCVYVKQFAQFELAGLII